MPSCRASSQPRDWTQVFHIAGGFFTIYLSYQESKRILEWLDYPLSSVSLWPTNRTKVSCIADKFFTSWATTEAQIFNTCSLNKKTLFHFPEIFPKRRKKKKKKKENVRSGDSTKVKRKPVFNRPWLHVTRQVPPWKIRGCLQKLKTVYANPMKNWPKEQILHIKGQVRLPACIEKDNPCFRKRL